MGKLKENQRKVETALKNMSAWDRQLGVARESLIDIVHGAEEDEDDDEVNGPSKKDDDEDRKRQRRKEKKEVSVDVKIVGLKARYMVDNRTILRQGRPDADVLPHFFERDQLIGEKEIEIRELMTQRSIQRW